MMRLGLSVFLGTYTSSQYTVVSTLSKELGFRLLTVILLYFNMKPTDYIGSHDFEAARHAAGWAGIAFATLSSVDAAVRPKFKDMRIFYELSIASLYVALWALFFSMYEKICLIFLGLAFTFTFLMLFGAFYKRCGGEDTRAKPHKSLVAMLKYLEQSGDAEMLNYLALVLIVINPEDPNTLAILEIVKNRSQATSTTT